MKPLIYGYLRVDGDTSEDEVARTRPAATQTVPQEVAPGLWREFGQNVLAAHHRQGLGAQCICGSLMYHCPVIAAAQRLGLPTDEPESRIR